MKNTEAQITDVGLSDKLEEGTLIDFDDVIFATIADNTVVTKETGNDAQLITPVTTANSVEYDVSPDLQIISDGQLTARFTFTQNIKGTSIEKKVVVRNIGGCYQIIPTEYTKTIYKEMAVMLASEDFTLDTTGRDGIWVVGLEEVNVDSTFEVKQGDLIEVYSTNDTFDLTLTGLDIIAFNIKGTWNDNPTIPKDIWFINMMNIELTEDYTLDGTSVITPDTTNVLWLKDEVYHPNTVDAIAGDIVGMFVEDPKTVDVIDLSYIPYQFNNAMVTTIGIVNDKYMDIRTKDLSIIYLHNFGLDDNVSLVTGALASLSGNRIYTDLIQLDVNVS